MQAEGRVCYVLPWWATTCISNDRRGKQKTGSETSSGQGTYRGSGALRRQTLARQRCVTLLAAWSRPLPSLYPKAAMSWREGAPQADGVPALWDALGATRSPMGRQPRRPMQAHEPILSQSYPIPIP